MAFFKRSNSKAKAGGGEGNVEGTVPTAKEAAPSGAGILLPSAVPSSGRNPASAIPGAPNWHARTVAAQGLENDAVFSQKVWVSIADILPRLPAHIVERGAVNPAQRLWFKLGDLAALAAESNYCVRVGMIAEMCPELFGPDLDFERDTELVFPWGRALEQIAALVPPRERPSKSRASAVAPAAPESPAVALVEEPAPPSPDEEGEVPRIEALNRRLVDLERIASGAERERDRLAAELADFRERSDARARELIAERDRLIHEKTKLSGDLARALEAHRKFVESERESVRLAAAVASSAPANEKLRQLTDQVMAIAAERDRLHREKDESEAALARAAEELRFELRRVSDERDALLREKEAAASGPATSGTLAEQELGGVVRERDAAMKLKDITLQDLNRVREASRRQIEALQAELARTRKKGAEDERALRAERDQLAHARAELSAQLAKLVEDQRSHAANLAAERAAMNRAREELLAEAAASRRAHETEVATLRAERDRIEAASSEMSARLLQIKETARRQIEALESQVERSAEEHKTQVEGLMAERERLRSECAALRDQVSARAAEAGRLRQELERLSEHFELIRHDSAKQISALSDEACTHR